VKKRGKAEEQDGGRITCALGITRVLAGEDKRIRGVPLDLICAVEWATDKSLFPLVAFIFFVLLPGRLRAR